MHCISKNREDSINCTYELFLFDPELLYSGIWISLGRHSGLDPTEENASENDGQLSISFNLLSILWRHGQAIQEILVRR